MYIMVKPDGAYSSYIYKWDSKQPIRVGDKVTCPPTDFCGAKPGMVTEIDVSERNVTFAVKSIRNKL